MHAASTGSASAAARAAGLAVVCTENRLAAIAPFYGAAPRPRTAIRLMCPVVGSWPGKDFTTKAAGVLETELTAAGIPHDLKIAHLESVLGATPREFESRILRHL